MLLSGDSVPGLYMIGAHGGALVAYGGQGERFEELITPDKEFRVYLTNDKFETMPLKKLSGSAQFSAGERFNDFIEIQAKQSPDGRYMYVVMPPTVSLPVYVRWGYNFNDGEGTQHLDLLFEEMVSVPQATTQPVTSQPGPAVTASQPSVSKPAATTQPS